jgi:hypothetical protein
LFLGRQITIPASPPLMPVRAKLPGFRSPTAKRSRSWSFALRISPQGARKSTYIYRRVHRPAVSLMGE